MNEFQFKTLENVEKAELAKVFNSAFADYFIKIEINEKNLSDKILTENIILEKSVGTFLNGRLVGFILIGIDEFNGRKTAYNGGTGVLPEFRGNNLTSRMYQFILPQIIAENIYFQRLEVVTENIPAIKVYQKVGYKKTKTLVCFKGKINISKINNEVELKFLDEVDEKIFSQFWNTQPSWQNSISALKRTKHLNKIAGAFHHSGLVGYIIFTESGRIKQFAVKPDFRHSGIGQTLFAFVKSELNNREILIVNVSKEDQITISFLEKMGLDLFLEQFEMVMQS